VNGCGGTARLRAGDHAFVAVTYSLPHQLKVHRLSLDEVAARIQRTIASWQAWSARCTYQGPYRDQVLRSALVLKALTNAPTGAIVAGPDDFPARGGGRGPQPGLPVQLAARRRPQPPRAVQPRLHR